MPDPIVTFLEDKLDNYLEDLRTLVGIDSGSFEKAGVDAVNDWIEVRLAGLGFSVERLPQLAGRMSVATGTLRATLWSAYRKLGVNSRPAAVARARSMGLLPPAVDEFDGDL